MKSSASDKNPVNVQHELYKGLTRLLSGPLVNYRNQIPIRNKRRHMDKYGNKFTSASGQHFKRSQYNPFDYLNAMSVANQTRAERYIDFDQMEFDALISSALNIYASEITTSSELRKMLGIRCSNAEIKTLLTALYYDILNVDLNLYPWVRSCCKYGDFYLYLDIDEKLGIQSVIGLPPEEIERLEGEDRTNPNYIQYQWNSAGMTFENWQVAHFRNLGNEKYLPYGCSILDPARRVWRQYNLLKDAMMAYRIVRSPERKVFTLDIGNMPPQDVEQYVQKFITEMKRNQLVDPLTGKVDLRYNPFCFHEDTKIKLTNGTSPTIKDMATRWENGEKDFEVYSLDHANGGNYVPGKVIWAGRTGTVNKLVEIELDDGGKIRVTPNHKMMLRDGEPIHAEDLTPGTSLMPFYKQFRSISPSGRLYEKIFDPKLNKFVFTHRMVAANKFNIEMDDGGFINTGKVVHHVDCTSINNSSDNLVLMEYDEHSRLHSEIGKKNLIAYNKDEKHRKQTSELNKQRNSVEPMKWYNGSELHKEHNKIRSEVMFEYWLNPDSKKKLSESLTIKLDNVCLEKLRGIARGLIKKISMDKFCQLIKDNDDFVDYYKQLNSSNIRMKDRCFNRHQLAGWLKYFGYADYNAFLTCHNPKIMGLKFVNNVQVPEEVVNHKVVSIKFIEGEFDVYNVTVDKYFNLAIQGESLSEEGGALQAFQSIEEDYILPTRGQSASKIETLPGGQFTGEVEDVQFLQNELCTALQVPHAYLIRGDGSSEDQSSLAQKDLRFARIIQRIQCAIISELEKIGIIHLYTLGYRDKDLISFSLSLNNPSKIAELQELEYWRTKFEVASSAVEGFFSKRWIAENLFKIPEDEFVRNQREMFYDRKIEAALSIASGEEAGDAGGGMDMGMGAGMDPFGPDGQGIEAMGPEGGAPLPDEDIVEPDSEPSEGKPDDDSMLLSKPGNRDPDEYTKPKWKGKFYKPETTDKRSMGARVRQAKSQYGRENASNTSRNVFKGMSQLSSMGKGIMENKNIQEEQILRTKKEIDLLTEGLANHFAKEKIDDKDLLIEEANKENKE